MTVRVHARVHSRHPEIADEDVRAAFDATLRTVQRTDTDPTQWLGVGMDSRSRLLEFVAIQLGPDEWLVFHAMPATRRALVEVGLTRR